MRWLVCISTSGIEQKIMAGFCIFDRLKIIYTFEYGKKPEGKAFYNFLEKKKEYILEKYGFDIESSGGYETRKHYIGNDYIEVLAELEATSYNDFSYEGYDGAIDVLLSAVSVLNHQDVRKWIKKLQFEKENS